MEFNELHKQTSATVFSGLIINYPLSITLLFFIMDYLGITNTFVIATMMTFFMTIFAYCRVYIVLRWFEKREPISKK
jgi:drug/metabolite transporter (DMT)-like permease